MTPQRKALERLISASERYAKICERNAGKLERNGLIGPTDVAKESAAQDAYEMAKQAALDIIK